MGARVLVCLHVRSKVFIKVDMQSYTREMGGIYMGAGVHVLKRLRKQLTSMARDFPL
jgi:hypothetical protein